MANRKSQKRSIIQVQGPDGNWIYVGLADKWSGGDLKVDTEEYPRGDGSTQRLGGDKKRENATATFLDDVRFQALVPLLEAVAGTPDNARVWRGSVDDRKQPLPGGRPYTLTGGLIGVGEPEGGGGENSGAERTLEFELNTEAIY